MMPQDLKRVGIQCKNQWPNENVVNQLIQLKHIFSQFNKADFMRRKRRVKVVTGL